MFRPTQRFHEHSNLLHWLDSLGLSPEARVLEVGCGDGDKLRLLAASGLNATGVEINPRTVAANLAAGLPCMTPEQFDRTDEQYDVLLLAHVVEHFLPADLVRFLDHYLDRVKVGGHLIVTAPTLWAGFFDEVDHVRPYLPQSLVELFGGEATSLQFNANNRLELVGVRLRRTPLGSRGRRPLLLPFGGTRRWRWGHALSSAAFKASFGLVGQTTGWSGVFRKLEPVLPVEEVTRETVAAAQRTPRRRTTKKSTRGRAHAHRPALSRV